MERVRKTNADEKEGEGENKSDESELDDNDNDTSTSSDDIDDSKLKGEPFILFISAFQLYCFMHNFKNLHCRPLSPLRPTIQCCNSIRS
jgi:hypothetical protein